MTTGNNAPAVPATGEQFRLERGRASAVVGSLGGALRSFTVDGIQLVETYPDDAIPPSAAGILLAPWPNRVAGGRWTLDGREQQLDITDPARGNAIHGLLRNTGYAPVEVSGDAVRLSAAIYPQHGYPFHLVHEVLYRIAEDGGLSVRQSLTSLSAVRAPFALGAHPFLRLGEVPTEDLILQVDAGTRLTTDASMIPDGQEPVTGDWDLRSGRRVGSLALDTAYTDLTQRGGKYRHVLTAPDGRSVQLWAGPSYGYVHVFVTDQFPGRSCAVALEPMTAPANAFNSGEGLRWLEPGSAFSAEWGIQAAL
ncbi:aldose 1-epimerase family protein [Arthrobacter caoxuetaonis]|uniref:aldose 1-epimerase family protein n=1 Tax=Arthrobacter caoxuetaonis TaxID=2886935 RepID=UPI001D140D16|nr:aldose 1-epimerase family protein [Arthrobacter caoxuetaonis]MCC3282292.1 aldose 1-epimerase family protein [Arthrobacter caoxuetaonis]